MSKLRQERANRSYLYHLISEGKRLNLWINQEGTELWFSPDELENLAKEAPMFDTPQHHGWILADPATGVARYDARINSVEEKLNSFKKKFNNYGKGAL